MVGRLVVAVLIGPISALAAIGGLGAGYHHRVAAPAAPEPHDRSVPRPVLPVPVADLAAEDLCVAWRRGCQSGQK